MNRNLTNLLNKINSLASVSHLSIWDIDDTLFVSPKTFIYVVKNNSIVKKLTTEEFNGYRLGGGEKFDFFEFRDANLFFNTARPLSANLMRAKRALESRNTFVLVLTARSDFNDKNTFLKKFETYGLNMSSPNIHVARSGNLGMGTAEGKKEVLRSVLNTGKFQTADMYDDDARNLDAFLSLKSNNVKLSAYIVKEGKISAY
jgi:hypothetical protein